MEIYLFLVVWMGLCFARDEVLWLLRHAEVWPQIFHNYSAANKKVATKVGIENALTDKLESSQHFNLILKP